MAPNASDRKCSPGRYPERELPPLPSEGMCSDEMSCPTPQNAFFASRGSPRKPTKGYFPTGSTPSLSSHSTHNLVFPVSKSHASMVELSSGRNSPLRRNVRSSSPLEDSTRSCRSSTSLSQECLSSQDNLISSIEDQSCVAHAATAGPNRARDATSSRRVGASGMWLPRLTSAIRTKALTTRKTDQRVRTTTGTVNRLRAKPFMQSDPNNPDGGIVVTIETHYLVSDPLPPEFLAYDCAPGSLAVCASATEKPLPTPSSPSAIEEDPDLTPSSTPISDCQSVDDDAVELEPAMAVESDSDCSSPSTGTRRSPTKRETHPHIVRVRNGGKRRKHYSGSSSSYYRTSQQGTSS